MQRKQMTAELSGGSSGCGARRSPQPRRVELEERLETRVVSWWHRHALLSISMALKAIITLIKMFITFQTLHPQGPAQEVL